MGLGTLGNWSVPTACIICQVVGQHRLTNLCASCKNSFPEVAYQCSRCALPHVSSQNRCGKCLKSPPQFDYAFSALVYQPPASQLIQKFKLGYDQTSIPVLSEIFCERLHSRPEWIASMPATIVPVALHWRRYLKRGYNQSLLIAQHVGEKLGLPVNANVLKRVRHSPSQQGQTRRERLSNLKEAFTADLSQIDENTFIVLDDVMTTGATMNAASTALKKAGARVVNAWSLARTPSS